MSHDSSRQPLLWLGIVLLTMGLVVGAAGAASPVLDTETSDTTTTSDIVADTTITSFEASQNNSTHVEASGLTANASMEVRDPDTGVVYYTNSSPDATNSSAGYYAWDINHSEWDDFPATSGGNKTFELRVYNDSTVDDPDTTNVTFYIESVDGRTVINVAEPQIGDDAIATVKEAGYSVLGVDTDIEMAGLWAPEAIFDQGSVAVDGNGSTIKYALANDSVAERFGQSADDASSGDWVKSTVLTVDGTPVKVFDESAADDVDENVDTYAVYENDSDDVTVYLGEDYENETTVDVHMAANKGIIGQWGTYGLQMTGFTDTSWPGIPDIDTSSLSLMALGIGAVLTSRRDLEV